MPCLNLSWFSYDQLPMSIKEALISCQDTEWLEINFLPRYEELIVHELISYEGTNA